MCQNQTVEWRCIVIYNKLIDKLRKNRILTKDEYCILINNHKKCADYLYKNASEVRCEVYGNDIFIRGLIEFTNYCKNDCFYCGIRKSNHSAKRYRLTKEEILNCCKDGYSLGMRTFVLQGGEDPYFTDEILCEIIREMKSLYPDCAVTLSAGERSFDSYKALRDAGADRYLLRHETATKSHYEKLHPKTMKFETRGECLKNLKSLGFQVGAGFMVGSPCQGAECLAEDLIYLHDLNPQMVGIGPFIAHHDTPFFKYPQGSAELTLFMLGLTRLTLPNALLPATTALGTVDENGRQKGILAGANVIMPNLSPDFAQENYMLYDNKAHTKDKAVYIEHLKKEIEALGCRMAIARGDYKEKK